METASNLVWNEVMNPSSTWDGGVGKRDGMVTSALGEWYVVMVH